MGYGRVRDTAGDRRLPRARCRRAQARRAHRGISLRVKRHQLRNGSEDTDDDGGCSTSAARRVTDTHRNSRECKVRRRPCWLAPRWVPRCLARSGLCFGAPSVGRANGRHQLSSSVSRMKKYQDGFVTEKPRSWRPVLRHPTARVRGCWASLLSLGRLGSRAHGKRRESEGLVTGRVEAACT